MSVINCPFDGNFCQKKQTLFDSWQKVIASNGGLGPKISPDLFAECPVKSSTDRAVICARYQQCVNLSQNLVKSNGQR